MDSTPVADQLPLSGSGPSGASAPTTDLADAAPAGVCPFPHQAATAPAPEVETTEAARCPVPHAAAPACPVRHGAGGTSRNAADLVVRRLLRIPDRPADLTDRAVYSAFQKSMLISAIRCTLTYVVFPFVLPTLHFLRGGAPVIGVFVGSFALVCDVFTIRRFFAVDHKYRWYFSTIAFSIMCLVATLWVRDVAEIVHSILG